MSQNESSVAYECYSLLNDWITLSRKYFNCLPNNLFIHCRDHEQHYRTFFINMILILFLLLMLLLKVRNMVCLYMKENLSSSFASLGRCCYMLLIGTKWQTTFSSSPAIIFFNTCIYDVFINAPAGTTLSH